MSERPTVDLGSSDDDLGEQAQDGRDGRASEAHTALTITRQYVKDLSFENPNAPAIYNSFADEGPELKVSVDIAATPLGDRVHEVVLHLNVTAVYQNTTAFLVELQYAAQARIDAEVSEERLERVLTMEVPRYLFPFVRNIVANATREGGFPPLLLNPISFRKIHGAGRSG